MENVTAGVSVGEGQGCEAITRVGREGKIRLKRWERTITELWEALVLMQPMVGGEFSDTGVVALEDAQYIPS